MLQLPGERRGHLRLGRRAGSLQGFSSGFEHSDEVGAGHGEASVDAVQSECDRTNEFGLAGVGRLGPGGVEQRPRLGGVARTQAQIRFDGEQADQFGVGQPTAGGGERGPYSGEMSGGLDECEPRGVGASGRVRPVHRRRSAGGRDGGGEVVGQFGREHRATPLVPPQQSGGDPVMQDQPTGWGQGVVDGLPVQVVSESGSAVVSGCGENAGGGRLGCQCGDIGRIAADHIGEHVGKQRRTGDGRGVQQRGAALGQTRQPAADHLTNGGGDVGGAARTGEQPAQLAGVEGVAAAAFVDQPGPVFRRRRRR